MIQPQWDSFGRLWGTCPVCEQRFIIKSVYADPGDDPLPRAICPSSHAFDLPKASIPPFQWIVPITRTNIFVILFSCLVLSGAFTLWVSREPPSLALFANYFVVMCSGVFLAFIVLLATMQRE
jgi:hypothetical protein